MKRILLKISYDGTEYHGWQTQPNSVTVQQVLQDGLQKVIKERPNVTGCSRTVILIVPIISPIKHF